MNINKSTNSAQIKPNLTIKFATDENEAFKHSKNASI